MPNHWKEVGCGWPKCEKPKFVKVTPYSWKTVIVTEPKLKKPSVKVK